MYKTPTIKNGLISLNNSVEGESIEMKMERIISEKAPIKDGAPIIYTERVEGVKAAYNIRSDRFEIAVGGTDKITKSRKAKREEAAQKRKGENKSDNGVEPIQGKSDKPDTTVK